MSEQPEQREMWALREPTEQTERMDSPVLQEPPAHKGLRVIVVLRDRQVLLARRDPKVHKDPQEPTPR